MDRKDKAEDLRVCVQCGRLYSPEEARDMYWDVFMGPYTISYEEVCEKCDYCLLCAVDMAYRIEADVYDDICMRKAGYLK